MEVRRLPDEFAMPPKEGATGAEPAQMPPEIHCMTEERTGNPREEFEGKSGGKKSEEATGHQHSLVKKLMMMPVAGTIAALSIVFASYGVDPLGDDFLNHETYYDRHEQPNEEKGSSEGKHKNLREVREYPGDITGVIIEVTYVPTGENYRAGKTGEEGLEEARQYVQMLGGDPDSLSYVKSEKIYMGKQQSDDFFYVGDLDDPENLMIISGSLEDTYQEIAYFEAFESMEIGDEPYHEWINEPEDDGGEEGNELPDYFPSLDNLEPEFEGKVAWNGNGPEWYVSVVPRGENRYFFLAAGAGISSTIDTVEGATYDLETNTLTLDNFTGDWAEINLMGNGFTIELIGSNSIRNMSIWGAGYGGSVRFTGTGSLVINEGYGLDNGGLTMEGEWSDCCIMVENGVTLEFYGAMQTIYYPPLSIKESNLSQTIYLAPGVEMTAYKDRDNASYGPGVEGYDGSVGVDRQIVYTQNGAVATYVKIAPAE